MTCPALTTPKVILDLSVVSYRTTFERLDDRLGKVLDVVERFVDSEATDEFAVVIAVDSDTMPVLTDVKPVETEASSTREVLTPLDNDVEIDVTVLAAATRLVDIVVDSAVSCS